MIAALVIGWIVTVIITAWVMNRLCERDMPIDEQDSDDFLEDYDIETEPLPKESP